jgi:hypothetical protein
MTNEFPTNIHLDEFELSQNGIPFVLNKEGEKVESDQYKQLKNLDPERAVEIYKALKKIQSEEFEKSKLVDANGELMIVWHGSPRKFNEFKTDAKGEWRWMNYGIHFSSSYEMIEEYSDKAYSALNDIRYSLAQEIGVTKDSIGLNDENNITKVNKVYNEIIADLIQNRQESRFYERGYKRDLQTREFTHEKDPGSDAIVYGKQKFGVEWALEIFGGEMPTKENTYFNEHNKLWLGANVGKYAYACVMNVANPFKIETTSLDGGFEKGELSHKESATDGTILYHPEGINVIGGG